MPLTMQSTLKPREMHGKLGKVALLKLRTINGGIRIVTLRGDGLRAAASKTGQKGMVTPMMKRTLLVAVEQWP